MQITYSNHHTHAFPLTNYVRRIWQTAKVHDPNTHPNWKYQTGFEYKFMNDASVDKWMKEQFDGSLLYWTWQRLPVGILVSFLEA